jgi:hypothetical protein
MSLSAKNQKLGMLILGVLSVILAANLVREYRAMQPGRGHAAERASTKPAPRVVKPDSHAVDDLLAYDPEVHFTDLKDLDSRPLPDEDRNPFDFVGGVIAPAPQAQIAAPINQAPAPPPPPPPPPLKAVGYNELPGGQKEAMVTYNDDLSVVHEGETVGAKYKVISITPQAVVVEDGDTHEKITLPISQ